VREAGRFRVCAPQEPRELHDYFRLRWRLLRAPWGQPWGSERDEYEDRALHRMVCDPSGRVLAVARLHRQDAEPGQGQIRFMAVDPSWRGRGLGRMLLRALEAEAIGLGLGAIELNAREAVVGFYAREGYRIRGEGHTLYGVIRHLRMTKALAPTDDRR